MSDARRCIWIVGATCAVAIDHNWRTSGAVFLALMALAPWSSA